MNKINRLILCAFALGVTVLNYSSNDSQAKGSEAGVTLTNIRALQASASEYTCNPISSSYCRVVTPTGSVIEGIGERLITP